MVVFEPTYFGTFWSLGDYFSAFNPQSDTDPDQVFNIDIHLDQRVDMHFRDISNILILLSDIGGVFQILLTAVLFFLYPLSKHSFFLSVFEQLYKVKTKSKSLLAKKTEDDLYSISFDFKTYVQLCIYQTFGFNCTTKPKKFKNLKALFKKAHERYSQEMSVENIIQDIRKIQKVLEPLESITGLSKMEVINLDSDHSDKDMNLTKINATNEYTQEINQLDHTQEISQLDQSSQDINSEIDVLKQRFPVIQTLSGPDRV